VVIGVFRAGSREETLAWTTAALQQALNRLWFQQIDPKLERRPENIELERLTMTTLMLPARSLLHKNKRFYTPGAGQLSIAEVLTGSTITRSLLRGLLTRIEIG
jgi:hypothetical protein